MKETRKRKEYKSPQRKLVNFFEKSRDRWKNKSTAAKQKVKRLQNRVRYLDKIAPSLNLHLCKLSDAYIEQFGGSYELRS